VNVTVALSTLLELDQQPGEFDGHGPIPAALARALAFDASGTWRRLLTDGRGRLVEVGEGTYRPPAAVARHVRIHNQTCCFPSCRRRATSCELDHIIAWADGGQTHPDNLQPLCPRHHHLKHETSWQVRREPDGNTRWQSPSGHTYARPPDELPIDTTTVPRHRASDAGEDQPPF
jgi:HNH endonuclease